MIPFHDSLKKRLQTVSDDLCDELALSPSRGEDAYGDYRERCGVIRGLLMAIDIADQLEADMQKG